jgi:acetyltransferase-like isoleucine patch superfamily enzyme
MLRVSDLFSEVNHLAAYSAIPIIAPEEFREPVEVYDFSRPPENVSVIGSFGANCRLVLRKGLRPMPGRIHLSGTPGPGRICDDITIVLMGLPGSANMRFFAGGSAFYFGRQMGAFSCGVTAWERSVLAVGDGSASGGSRIELSDSEVLIGRGCLFADSTILQSHDGHGIVDLKTMSIVNSKRSKISIEDHVWVGRGATILKDVTVGRGAIIANNAVVTKPCPPCTLVGGMPAKTIKRNVSWSLSREMIMEQEQALLAMYKANLGLSHDVQHDAPDEHRLPRHFAA